jgi:hypothetical protein
MPSEGKSGGVHKSLHEGDGSIEDMLSLEHDLEKVLR